MPVVETAIDRVAMRARGLYGLGLGEIPVEGQDLWATFGKDFTQDYVRNQEEVTIYQDTLRGWVIGQNTGPGYGMNCNPQNVPWTLFRTKLVGFADVDSMLGYVHVASGDYRDRMELERGCKRVAESMRSNRSPEWADCSFEPVFSAVRFVVCHADATRVVRVWRDPDVWVVVYDLGRSGEQKLTAYVRDDTYWEAPEYVPAPVPEGARAGLVGSGGAESQAPVDEAVAEFLEEELGYAV